MLAALRAWSAARAARYAEPAAQAAEVPLARLLALPDAAFDRALLARDPQAHRLTATQAGTAIARAVADGEAEAARFATGTDPREAAREAGIAVEYENGGNRFGSIFQFAEYTGRPPRIRIYMQALAVLREALAEADLMSSVPDPVAVYVAHELYHHIDTARAAPIARAAGVVTLAIGPLRFRSGLISLAEIGACAFARTLTGIGVHPGLLDHLALRAVAPERAAAMAAELVRRG